MQLIGWYPDGTGVDPARLDSIYWLQAQLCWMLWAPGQSPSLYAGRQARHTVYHIKDIRDQDGLRAVNMNSNLKIYDVVWRTLVMSFKEC